MKKKGNQRLAYVVAVVLVFIVILGFSVFGYLLWAGLSWWPGSYEYTETRWFETAEEEAALEVAELFDYSVIPVGKNRTLSTVSFYQDMLEYSVVPLAESPFLSSVVLSQYQWINQTFNPFLTPGGRKISYVANSTYLASLNVILNATALTSYGSSPLVFSSTNGTFAETWFWSEWRGGFWNGTGYTGFEYARNQDYAGPQFATLNYTDVYFIDILFTILRDGAGSRSFFGDMFRYVQRVIVDATGRVLLASVAPGYLAWI